ncbi:MAG: MFS transporter [Pseudomonadota bacterium]
MFELAGALRGERPRDVIRRSTIVALVSFLTLIDLFGSQALLPQLVVAFEADPQVMGVAVNASTFGMAISGLVVAWFADRINRKRGIWISLALLSIPTFFLGVVDTVAAFTALRVLQGIFMAAAFTLTLTYLSEQCDVTAAGGAMAAYITGNVASNLFGRLLAVSAADQVGLSGSFWTFSVLNLVGAGLAFLLIGSQDRTAPERGGPPLDAWKRHLGHPALRISFLIGFAILFVFVGVYTYVNLYLTDDLGLNPNYLGLVYLVFIPAMFTTPYASKAVSRYGPQRVFQVSAGVVLLGLALAMLPSLPLVLAGLALIGAGTFFMQAAATGFVGRTALTDRAVANGLYLTSYYIGGLTGAFLLGYVYDIGAWRAVGIGLVLVMIALIPLAKVLANPGPEVLPRSMAKIAGGDGKETLPQSDQNRT